MPHLLRGLLLPHRLQREARLLPQLPRRPHARAAHHRRRGRAQRTHRHLRCSDLHFSHCLLYTSATASGASSSSTAARPNARAAISSDDDAGPRPKRPLQAATHAWQAEHRLLSKRIALSAITLPYAFSISTRKPLTSRAAPTGLSAAGAKTPHAAAAAPSSPRVMPFKHT